MLQVWLPFINNLNNQGLSDATIANNGATVSTSGKIGSCYSFDGNDDFISIDCPDLYRTFSGGSQPFSIAFWIYHADSTRGVIFGDYGLSGGINFNIELSANHHIRYYWNGRPDKTFVNTTLEINVWTHIVLTYDGNKICVYKNGLLQADTYAGTLIQRTKNSGLFYLGRDSRTGATALNGRINDFRIYSHCLSPIECKKISSALVLHYTLSSGGGENLLKNSSLSTDFSNWSRSATSNMEIVEKDGFPAMHVSFSEFKITRYIAQNIISYIDTSNLDQIYTVSADVLAENITKGTTNPMMTPCYFGGSYDDNGTSKWLGATYLDGHPQYYCYDIAGKGWCHFVTRIKFAQVPTKMSFNCYFRDFTGDVWIRNVKFEVGDKATPWTPNPADDEYAAMGYDDGIEYDTSGYQNNGELITPSLVSYSSNTARYNVSTVFGMQSSSSFSYLNTSDFYVPDEFTISYWWYYDSDTKIQSNPPSTLAYAHTGSGRGYMNYGVHHYDNHFYINFATMGSDTMVYGSYVNFNATDKAWNFVTLTFDGYIFKVYKNGKLIGSWNPGSSEKLHIVRNDKILRIGYDQAGGVVRGCAGNLSDFRIYATPLTADEIADLYHTPISLSNNGTLLTQGELSEV